MKNFNLYLVLQLDKLPTTTTTIITTNIKEKIMIIMHSYLQLEKGGGK
jgi:hypothetical protein